jgi:hypothetical protein
MSVRYLRTIAAGEMLEVMNDDRKQRSQARQVLDALGGGSGTFGSLLSRDHRRVGSRVDRGGCHVYVCGGRMEEEKKKEMAAGLVVAVARAAQTATAEMATAAVLVLRVSSVRRASRYQQRASREKQR